jgi:predicted metal-dependent hydrolase
MWRDMRATGRMVGGVPSLLARIGAYLLPGFHPNQHGDLTQALQILRAEGLDVAPPVATAG